MKTTFALCVAFLTFVGITKAVQPDNKAPQVLIEAKFIDFGEEAKDLLATLGATRQSTSVAGLLYDDQLRTLWKGLERTKGVDVLSSPRVITLSGQEAKIEIGREFAYKDGEGKAATKNLGTTLTMLPKVTGEDQIGLALSSRIVGFEGGPKHANGLEQPIFSVRKVTANVSMTSGHTVVLRFPSTPNEQTVEDRSPEGVITKTENVTRHTMLFVTARLVAPGSSQTVEGHSETK